MRFIVIVKFGTISLLKVIENEITVSLKSRPKGGKANLELIQKLADHFGISKDGIRIISGRPSKKKLVEINI